MSQRQSKRARQRVRSLQATVAAHGPYLTPGSPWNDAAILDALYTPRQRRRAEAVVARRKVSP